MHEFKIADLRLVDRSVQNGVLQHSSSFAFIKTKQVKNKSKNFKIRYVNSQLT